MKAFPLTLLAAAILASPASAESVAPLIWTSCGTVSASTGNVVAHTECTKLTVPRDYAQPAAGTIDLDVIRVVADGERGERHDGSLLLEPDEFAPAVHETVRSTAAAWREGDEGWRDVARRLDIVGLAPRSMAHADGHDCVSATSSLPHHASLGIDTSFSKMMVAEHLALAVATACQNDPMHGYIGAHPRIEDVERLRQALGQAKLHVLATGRGGWVAARYAERYPQHVGRMLLDSSWDADGSVAEAMEARVAERGRRAQSLPRQSDDPYGFGPRAASASPSEIASVFAMRCNDSSWGTSSFYWRTRTRELQEKWPSGVGNETFQGMVCSEWPGAFTPSSFPMLDGAPSFLMVHAEFDSEAPLRNASMMLNAHPNARMVVARGLRDHGIVMRDGRPCVSFVASRFLADGSLPESKLTNCRIRT